MSDTTPANKNFLSQIGFKLVLKKAPAVNFFVQKAALPSLSLGSVTRGTPFVKIPTPGDHLDYGDFNVTFKVDEQLQNYLEIWNWMVSLGVPASFDQYPSDNQPDSIVSDMSLILLSSAQQPLHEISFIDAFPVRLTDLEFDATANDIEYLTATASFKYQQYTITTL